MQGMKAVPDAGIILQYLLPYMNLMDLGAEKESWSILNVDLRIAKLFSQSPRSSLM